MSLEMEIAKVVGKIDQAIRSDPVLASEVRDRRANFETKIGSSYQCPHCWIIRGEQGIIRPIERAANGMGQFRCSTCGLNFEIAL